MSQQNNQNEEQFNPGNQGRASFAPGTTTQGGSNFGQGSHQLGGESYHQGDTANAGTNYENEADRLGGSTTGTNEEGSQSGHRAPSDEENLGGEEKVSQGTGTRVSQERRPGQDQDLTPGHDRREDADQSGL